MTAPTPQHTTHHDDCGCQSAALRAECAKWRECADALAGVLCREDIYSGLSPREFVRTRVSGITLGPETDAAIARYDALRKETERG